MTQEDKEYLKTHLKIEWQYYKDELYLCLKLEEEVISKIKFGQY